MLFLNTVAVVSYPAGKLLATFGGTQSDYSGMSWNWEHGHDVHSDHIWIFNNNQSGNAHVLGFTYNQSEQDRVARRSTTTRESPAAPSATSKSCRTGTSS